MPGSHEGFIRSHCRALWNCRRAGLLGPPGRSTAELPGQCVKAVPRSDATVFLPYIIDLCNQNYLASIVCLGNVDCLPFSKSI